MRRKTNFPELHPSAKADAKRRTPLLCFFLSSLLFSALTGCSDFLHPVDETDAPTEYSYNYWLLKNNYLYEDELSKLPETGDSAGDLYKVLDDPYTRYVPPSKSVEATISMNTTIVSGDVGMYYTLDTSKVHPLYVRRVFYNGPAAKAGVPRYGNILKINGEELTTTQAWNVYDSILSHNLDIELLIAYNGDTLTYKMQKETFYAPSVFVDTLYQDSANGYPGIVFITIEGFKPETAHPDSGTYGELRDYLDSTRNSSLVRVLDLRGNPGGHINQCLAMADLFVPSGLLSTRKWRTFDANGDAKIYKYEFIAKEGDPGESGKFIILANKGSASCAEIFIAAVSETVDIPFVGITTYGKGIGQTTWTTVDKGLSIITNTEFLTPKGISYHGKGIEPQYHCDGIASNDCAAQAVHMLYNVPIPKLSTTHSLAKQSGAQTILKPHHTDVLEEISGGALEWADSSFYQF